MTDWPIADLRHAFDLDDWPMDGTVGACRLDLTGRYREMFGTGRMRIDQRPRLGRTLRQATGDLELEGRACGSIASRCTRGRA